MLPALCQGNPPMMGGFSSQRVTNTERVFMSCCPDDDGRKAHCRWYVPIVQVGGLEITFNTIVNVIKLNKLVSIWLDLTCTEPLPNPKMVYHYDRILTITMEIKMISFKKMTKTNRLQCCGHLGLDGAWLIDKTRIHQGLRVNTLISIVKELTAHRHIYIIPVPGEWGRFRFQGFTRCLFY